MSVNHQPTTFTRHARASRIWLAYDDARAQWLAEVIVRRPAAIQYLVRGYTGARPTWRRLRSDACRYGHLSPRPYRLGQPCDGSITTCVLALYEDFCISRRLDPAALIRHAYDDVAYTKQDFSHFRRAADWEGTAYPPEWSLDAIGGLLESLHEIYYHSLAAVVEEAVDAKK